MGASTKKKKKETVLKNYVSWFEIPANNFQESLNFYNFIFDIKMESMARNEYHMAFFPAKNGIGGAIVAGPGSVPSEAGPLLYLNGGADLSLVLNRVEQAGGRIIMNKTLINKESGYFAIFLDSEGNKLALHSNN